MRVEYVLDVYTENEDQAFYYSNFLPLVQCEAPGLHKLRLNEGRSGFGLKNQEPKTSGGFPPGNNTETPGSFNFDPSKQSTLITSLITKLTGFSLQK